MLVRVYSCVMILLVPVWCMIICMKACARLLVHGACVFVCTCVLNRVYVCWCAIFMSAHMSVDVYVLVGVHRFAFR